VPTPLMSMIYSILLGTSFEEVFAVKPERKQFLGMFSISRFFSSPLMVFHVLSSLNAYLLSSLVSPRWSLPPAILLFPGSRAEISPLVKDRD